jgi:hypothetical protein
MVKLRPEYVLGISQEAAHPGTWEQGRIQKLWVTAEKS